MQSGQINASQLMAAFLGKAKDKLGQKITKNDFSGELQKHLPKQLNAAGMTDPKGVGAGKTDGSTVDSKASATGASSISAARTDAASAKIKEIKSKAKAEKSLLVSNPAILETVLANLHYPAQARDQCQALLSKQGRISIQDLKSILDTRPDTGSGAAGQVPAATVGAMVGSIVKASGGSGVKGAGAANSFKSSVAIKREGSYTRDELRSLLEKVVQASQKTDPQTQPGVISSKTSTASQTVTAESLKVGQTEELVSTVLPSFISVGGKVSSEKALAGVVASRAPDSQTALGKSAQLQSPLKAGSGESSSSGRVGAEKAGASSREGEKIAPGMEAVLSGGGNGAPKASAAVAAPAQEQRTGATATGFTVATGLADLLKTVGASAQKGSAASATPSGGDSLKDVQSRAALGGQDTPMLGKQIEKFIGAKEQPSGNGVLQSAGAKPEDNLIPLQQMNNSGGDGANSYDRNRQDELVQKAREGGTPQASSTNATDEGIGTILSSYISQGDKTGQSLEAGSAGAGSGRSSTSPTETLKAIEELLLGTLGGAAAAKPAAQLGGKGGSAEPAVVEAPSSNLQEINGKLTDYLAQAGVAMNEVKGSAEVKKDSVKLSVQDVSKSGKSGGPAASDKAGQFGGEGDTTQRSAKAGTAGAAEASSTASDAALSLARAGQGSTAPSSAWSLAQQEAVSMPSGAMDQDAQSSEGLSSSSVSGKDAPASVSAASGADGRLAAIQQSALGQQGITALAKRMDETVAGKDASPGLGILQASTTNLQAINMHPADNSGQSGFAMYDPYRAVELANSMMEQMGSGSGRQLVLEMDPDGLGKINLKIGARKDEISVEALTQSEPARQALMSHSVELRQDLRDQGLVLGKFMVDVNGGKAGGGNSAETNQPGGKGGEAAKSSKVRTVRKSEAPIRAASMTGRSQLSLFA